MNTRLLIRSVCVALTLVFCIPAVAHHGYAAYDMTVTESLTGTITTFEMANPHSFIEFDVKDKDGNVQHWWVETGATVRGMKASGFTFDTLKPGDKVTIYFSPAKNGKHVGAFKKVILPDGHVLPTKEEAPANP